MPKTEKIGQDVLGKRRRMLAKEKGIFSWDAEELERFKQLAKEKAKSQEPVFEEKEVKESEVPDDKLNQRKIPTKRKALEE